MEILLTPALTRAIGSRRVGRLASTISLAPETMQSCGLLPEGAFDLYLQIVDGEGEEIASAENFVSNGGLRTIMVRACQQLIRVTNEKRAQTSYQYGFERGAISFVQGCIGARIEWDAEGARRHDPNLDEAVTALILYGSGLVHESKLHAWIKGNDMIKRLFAEFDLLDKPA